MHIHSPGINIPGPRRSVIRAVNGDTVSFTVTVRHPGTGRPVSRADAPPLSVSVTLAENRFAPVIWSGSLDSGVTIDEHRPGLVHVDIPRVVTSLLRRGVYAVGIVADDGVNRHTRSDMHLQIEYGPASPVRDIPYRSDDEEQTQTVIEQVVAAFIAENGGADMTGKIDKDELRSALEGITDAMASPTDLKDKLNALLAALRGVAG